MAQPITEEAVPQNGDRNGEMQERNHFFRVISAFKSYKTFVNERVSRAKKSFHSLPEHHQQLLPDYLPHLENIRTCIDHNFEIIKLIVKHTDQMFENSNQYSSSDCENSGSFPKPVLTFDMDKVSTTLKQFVRDWSSEGREERDACYGPIIEEIQRRFPSHKCNTSNISVLVPGAGLGRLAYEIANLGYTCQGNEFSLYMLFASHFVLNKTPEVETFTLYPWISQFSNNKLMSNQIRPVRFPDVNPALLPSSASFSMVAGDFLEIYSEKERWDCVATSYFIDTAHNVLAYIENIYKILKPGGYWINLGPLLYHFDNLPKEMSIELGYDVVRRVITDMGFEFLREEPSVPSTYIQDRCSMLRYEYDCVFFVCQKPVHRLHDDIAESPESPPQESHQS
ncbi:carnosine N-methyltransferase-like [Amphiura filiformis]|uniref:carnosine N-methyltransferase-like n=1 Tax=Amphiura filiformis TaxID=82378 RepID=UPI003B225630